MKPTLATIAAELGVSKATVSMALRSSTRISKEMRARVLETADRLGYRPNPMISALMTSLRGSQPQINQPTLCFLTCFPERDGWKRFPTYVQCFEGIRSRAEHLGYRVEVHWYGEANASGERLSQILNSRGIPGIIIAPLPSNGFKLDLAWDQFSTVAIGHTFNAFPAHRVSNHQFHTISEAMNQALNLGYTRPGLVMDKQIAARVENVWLAGYHVFQVTHEQLEPIPPLLAPHFSQEIVTAWIEEKRPDVIITTDERVFRWLDAMGLRVPEDIGYIHLDWVPEKGDFSGVDQLTARLGVAAVDLLVEQIYNNERGIPEMPKTVLIDGRWRAGPTVRPRN